MTPEDAAIFDAANEIVRRITNPQPSDPPLDLAPGTVGGPALNALVLAINRGHERAAQWDDAMAVIRYYAQGSIYETAPANTPIAEDRGATARAFVDRMAD